ncbi:MAG TPA: thiamine phosphate synthase [Polyangia bacterium]|nr:thiamine phosphate synthase [Polyangia bacterium]
MTAAVRGLYGMIDLPVEAATSDTALALAGALVDGGARIMQLRVKGADARDLLSLARVMAPWCRAREVAFVVNDRLDVALAAGADGVHLGQDDLPAAAARPLVPAGFTIGVSTHDEDQARAALAHADYIAFGPCFTTSSKRNPDPVVGLERLARVCAFATRPVVAIGGIDLNTVADVARAGASAAAIIRAVNGADDVAAAARLVSDVFAGKD